MPDYGHFCPVSMAAEVVADPNTLATMMGAY